VSELSLIPIACTVDNRGGALLVQVNGTTYVCGAGGDLVRERSKSINRMPGPIRLCWDTHGRFLNSEARFTRHFEAVSVPNVIATTLEMATSEVGPFATPT